MELFDFGFTAVNEDELDAVQTAAGDKDKLDRLYQSILPLLANLKANPEKDYIYWPNRVTKVEEFEALLRDIYES